MDASNSRTISAIERARKAHDQARKRSVRDDEEGLAAEAEELATDALAHLDGGRWDEALVCAEAAQTLGEDAGEPELWREFALLVEEAAEIGRGEPC
jgi:hypothetical protein